MFCSQQQKLTFPLHSTILQASFSREVVPEESEAALILERPHQPMQKDKMSNMQK